MWGAAKNADAVIVRFPLAEFDTGVRELFAVSVMMSAMAAVMKDILANGLQGKAVINCSWGMRLITKAFMVGSLTIRDRLGLSHQRWRAEGVAIDHPRTY